MNERRLLAAALLVTGIGSAAIARSARAQVAQLPCDSLSIKTSEIRRVRFVGNTHFTAEQLDQHVSTTESDLGRRLFRFFGTPRCLGPQHITLADDIGSLRRFYADQGFPDSKIDTVVTPHPGGGLDVTFRILAEGQPVVIDSLAITGLEGVRQREEILRGLNVADTSRRFSQALVGADIDSIRARLANVGYPLSAVTPDTQTIAPKRKSVVLAIDPGPFARFGRITYKVTPYDTTKSQAIPDSAIAHLLGFRSGDIYSYRAVLAARRTLYSLGAYLHAEPDRDTSRTRADSVVDIIWHLGEDQMHQVTSEFGWATLDCFQTQAQYTDKALFGSARQFEFDGQLSKLGWAPPSNSLTRGLCLAQTLSQDPIASDTLNYNFSATLREPGSFGDFSIPSLTLYSERTGAYQAYLRTTLIGFGSAVTRPLGKHQLLEIGYNLEYGHTTAQPAVLCFIFRACDPTSQKELTGEDKRLAVASVQWTEDLTDSPVVPTRGTIVHGDFRMSNGIIGSDSGLSFYKGVGDARWYHTLFGPNVLMLRLQVGGIAGGAQTGGAELPPPQERLYAGGATSVRGFQQNEVGALIYVEDTIPQLQVTTVNGKQDTATTLAHTPLVIPVGGNSLVVGNIEYRVPGLFSLYPRLFQTVFFTDVGDVWTRENDTLHVGGQQLRWTPGIGFRYYSPVGPIQVNVGYNPYAFPLGPLYYSPGVAGGFALYCISPAQVGGLFPSNATAIANANTSTSSAANCPATYAPPKPATFFRRLAFTLSIGPDF